LQLNTLGDAATRDAWRAALVEHFSAHRDQLSEDSLARLEKNPLRILDSKDPADRPVADSAPGIDDFLTPEAADFFAQVAQGLDAAKVSWTRNDRLVRGLDYYRHTAFEFVTDRLGAQGTVLAGGRYDGLVEALGGPHTPSVGWAAGIERLAMLLDQPPSSGLQAVIIPMGGRAEAEAVGILAMLRGAGIAADMSYKGNMKRRMARADASGARFAVLLGEDELGRGEAGVKDMRSGSQEAVPLGRLAEALTAR
jgi:histidyl-tRNA synthetase